MSKFTIEDFPIGSWLYRIKVPKQYHEPLTYYYVKLQVKEYETVRGQQYIVAVNDKTNDHDTFSVNGFRLIDFHVPEYIYNHIHGIPNGPLNDRQKLQCIFLTGDTEADARVKMATKTYNEFWQDHLDSMKDIIDSLRGNDD